MDPVICPHQNPIAARHWARTIACDLATQPNERRCGTMKERHILDLAPCCPISHNPAAGSVVEIGYTPGTLLLEVEALRAYVDSYQGGRGDVRSMEGMIQQIAQDCADVLRVAVYVSASLVIHPRQRMILECAAQPRKAPCSSK